MEMNDYSLENYYEELYFELKEKCNPENFLDPYDSEKVKVSNQIFSQLDKYSNSISALTYFRDMAIEKLGIHFSANKLYDYLSNKYNPKQFVGTLYDAEKLNIANEIYSKIQQCSDNVVELEKIAKQYKVKMGLSSATDSADGLVDDNDSDKSNGKAPYISLVITIIALFGVFYSIFFSSNNKNTYVEATDSLAGVIDSTEISNDFYLEFPQYGFALDAPCEMKDVSAHSSGNFLINYGGTTDENDPAKMAAYQLIVNRAPIGYKDIPKDQYEKKVDEFLRMQAQRFLKYKPIRFSYDEYPGYACETTHNGYRQKGVIFVKENYIIALTVISNNDLDTKFSAFTNRFKSLAKQ